MAYLTGVVLFALAIFISVCLHEAGHMATAKAFGMKVTRYFAGFGPTLFSFRRGETEYGLKAIPLGGFVKIVGMTPQDDDVAPEDEPRAMWRAPLWKRTVVMAAGSVSHFILGFVVLWLLLVAIGLPNPDLATTATNVSVQACVIQAADRTTCQPGDPVSPAKKAGLQDHDKIVAVNGTKVTSYPDLVKAIRAAMPGRTTLTYERDGVLHTTPVDLVAVQRPPIDNTGAEKPGNLVTVGALGVGPSLPKGAPETVRYGPISGVGQAGYYTGQMFSQIGASLKRFPARVPALWRALSGQPRDPNGPISVVGASRLGGEAVEYGSWATFFTILITLNFFIGVFNLLPLLPLDGGHMAIAFFERIRSWLYRRLGRRDPGRVNYLKLMPVTYAVILIFGAFSLLTIAADIVNPVTIFGK
ncbi:MAG: site-2 protease family protein [Micromonosporaceae bacterium]|nr:site-2 protease family protein [Micromonosporaceae bacterium]